MPSMLTTLPITRYDLPAMLDARGYRCGAEIGVQHGYFSYYLLRHSSLECLWSVDSWSGKYSELMGDASAYLSEFGSRSRVVRASSTDAAALARDASVLFDFVYIDADHRRASVLRDIESWMPLVRNGGVLAGHDFVTASRCGVIEAVTSFCRRRSLPLYITREPWASWLVEVPPASDPPLSQIAAAVCEARQQQWHRLNT